MARLDLDAPREDYDQHYWADVLWRLQEEIETLGLSQGDTVLRVTVAADYAASQLDCIIGVTNTDSPRTITLPTLTRLTKRITVKDESGGAGSNLITVDVAGSGTIDGLSSNNITNNYGSLTVYSDGAGNYFTL